MLTKKDNDLAIRCLEIYMGDYSVEKQYASSIILKMIFKDKYRKLMEEVREATGFKVNNRNSSAVIRWAKNVKKKGICEICGSKEKLEAHHKVPWEYSIKGRTDINNGMCLCSDCHKMMHNDIKYVEYLRGCAHERK